MITLTNTLTGKKETFKTLIPGEVKLYVCGITPYDYAHVGHGRCYVTFDVLYRLLRLNGFEVTYVRNFTDIDDKLLNKAAAQLGDKFRYLEVAQTFIDAYEQDMKALHCLKPHTEPRVTETIEGIIDFVRGLITKGYAYEVDGDVYYSVKKFPTYGRLSKRNISDLQAGARVEINEKKQDPLDFALWKGEAEGTFWKSPWGYGRPGWHIECSAMAAEHLGESIDIHGGGMDLIFPHHENEIAQSEAFFGNTFSQFWVHNAFVRIDQEKMSKSLNNFFTLRDVFAQFDPMVVRFYFLQHHYKSPLDFSFEGLHAAQKAYNKLCKYFALVDCSTTSLDAEKELPLVQKLVSFLNDDINSVGALGVVFENLDSLGNEACGVKLFLQDILGVSLQPLPEAELIITPEIQCLLDQREVARASKDWAQADALRDQLVQLGYEVKDKKKP